MTEQMKITDGRKVLGVQFALTWENNGTTQAEDLRICQSREDVPVGNNSNLPDKCEEPWRAVVGPKGSATSTPVIFYPPLLDSLRDGKTMVSLWGWAKYRDAFPNTPEHITRCCVQFDAVLGDVVTPNSTTPVVFQTVECPNPYACSDEECQASH